MKSVFESPPAYSFGSRHKAYGLDKTPGRMVTFSNECTRSLSLVAGPNTYVLPGMLGKTVESAKKQAPMHSLTGRSKHGGFDEDLQRTPGPGTAFELFE